MRRVMRPDGEKGWSDVALCGVRGVRRPISIAGLVCWGRSLKTDLSICENGVRANVEEVFKCCLVSRACVLIVTLFETRHIVIVTPSLCKDEVRCQKPPSFRDNGAGQHCYLFFSRRRSTSSV